jgi:hypothetical protein
LCTTSRPIPSALDWSVCRRASMVAKDGASVERVESSGMRTKPSAE